MKKDYKQESENLIKAIDIAINCFNEEWPEGFNQQHVNQFISVYQDTKESCLTLPRFRNLRNLKEAENDIFIYFQEGKGKTVELFWKRLKEERLPYKRKNPLTAILKRKRIKNEFEYDYVTDIVVALQQEGTITDEQGVELKMMLGEFEKKVKN
jgi:hypothetical protein